MIVASRLLPVLGSDGVDEPLVVAVLLEELELDPLALAPEDPEPVFEPELPDPVPAPLEDARTTTVPCMNGWIVQM